MCLTLISSFCGSELSQMNTNVRETRINFISYTLDLVSFYDINTRSIDFPKAWVDLGPDFYFPKVRELYKACRCQVLQLMIHNT